jgi:VWFA-related protein
MRRSVVALAALLIGSLPAAALNTVTEAEPFGEPIDARGVDVEAVVTDREGNRVLGLSAGDFRLLVDGREVPIDSFTEVAEGAVGRNYLIFIDETFPLAVQRDLVLWEVERDLGRLGPQDRMAIVAFDGARLHRLADWTTDRAALATAFAEARRRPALGKPFGSDVDPGVSNGQSEQVARVAGAAAAALGGLSLPPGRRTMLLLSGGWPSSAPALHLVREANRLGYTLYPVDVPGVDLAATVGDATSDREQAVHDTLLALAARTGGEAALNAARLNALELAEEDTRSYYRLGFLPLQQAGDRDHRIELEVLRPDLTVRARSGFTDLSPRTLAGMEAESVTEVSVESGE